MEENFKLVQNPPTSQDNPTNPMVLTFGTKGNQGIWKIVQHKKSHNSKVVE